MAGFPLAFQPNPLYNLSMSLSLKLFRLQQIDSQIDAIRLRLAELEELLQNQVELNDAREKAHQAENKLKEEQKKLHQLEIQSRDYRIKIEQSEATLYSGKVRNPKELQDLQNEVVALKRYLEVLEERQLESMLAVEEAEKFAQTAREELRDVEARTIEKQAHHLSEKNNCAQKLERLEIERKAACEALNAEEYKLYNQLRQSRRGIAVAKIVERTCSACGALLTPALIQYASSSTQTARCPTCGRILFAG